MPQYRWVGGRGFGFEGGVKAQFVWNFNQGIDMCLCNWLTFLRTVKEVGSLRFLLHLKWWNRSFLDFFRHMKSGIAVLFLA